MIYKKKNASAVIEARFQVIMRFELVTTHLSQKERIESTADSGSDGRAVVH